MSVPSLAAYGEELLERLKRLAELKGRREGGEVGPAQGAARLARLAVTGESAADFCHAPPVAFEAMPESDLRDEAQPRLARFRELYPRLRGAFR